MRTSAWLAAAMRFLGAGRKSDDGLATSGIDRRRRGPLSARVVFAAIVLSLLTLALCAGLATAAGGTSDESALPSEVPTVEAPQEAKSVELKNSRTATSDTFALEEGKQETRIYPEPVNYRDAAGRWQPIEENLELGAGGAIGNKAGPVVLTLPRQLGTEPVRLGTGKGWVSDRLLGSPTGVADVARNSATYPGAKAGTTFQLRSLPGAVKETIELADASQPSTFRFELAASSGVTPVLEEDGSVVFRQANGTALARVPAPTVADGASDPLPVASAASYSLSQMQGGSWELTLTVDRGWLESSSRAWPVKIDPSIISLTLPDLSPDCTIYAWEGEAGGHRCSTEGWQSLTEDYEPVYYPTGVKAIRSRGILKFDTSSIPATADVREASINLDASGVVNAEGVELLRLTSPWTGSANWRYPWTHEGGDIVGATEPGQTIHASEREKPEGWWKFNVPGLVREWVAHPAANDGAELKVINEGGECTPTSCPRHYVQFYSAGRSNPAERPYLSVVYIPQAPLSSKVVSPTEGTRTARRLKLRSKWTAAGVEGVTFQYREGKSGEFQTIPAELVSNAEGKAVTWPVPVGFGERETKPLYLDAAHLTSTLRKKVAWSRSDRSTKGRSGPPDTARRWKRT
jgi:hypothetical protein